MLMVQDYFEPFCLLEKAAVPDGLGSEAAVLSHVMDFRGGLTHAPGQEITTADRVTLKSDLLLLHELDVTLGPGDYVRRVKDGTVYHVTSRTADMRAPAFSGLQFAQVAVERLVIPC